MQKITSIELPEDSTYVLTKIKAIKNPNILNEGITVSGTLLSNPIKLEHPCVVGYNRAINDGLITTRINKIEVEKHRILIHTENSVYELKEVVD